MYKYKTCKTCGIKLHKGKDFIFKRECTSCWNKRVGAGLPEEKNEDVKK